jgi:hypothetical protein
VAERDDIPQDGEAQEGDEEIGRPESAEEAEARAQAEREREIEANRVRVEALVAKVEAVLIPDGAPVVAEFEEGTLLLDAAEEALIACLGEGLHPRDAWVKLPRGYATVEFLLMVYAVSR